MIDKDLIIRLQQEQLNAQGKLISSLNNMVKLLECRIEILENNQKKNSSDSSRPPSSDIGKLQRT
jgi:hypothetical protein